MTGTHELPGTSKPAAVKWIIGLACLKLAAFALVAVAAIVFLSPFQSEVAQGFREGWLRAAGYTPQQYGSREAGEIVGRNLIPAVLAVLLLVFLGLRKLTALRVVAGLTVLVSLVQPLGLLLMVPVFILTLAASTKAYCRGAPRSDTPGAAA